ncbi:hypothetical protein TNCV_5074621 [Trichonephila clavipes]|nr:hypothetical protein TNCV_5074621 [Trichonephila clavipes]
MVCKFGERVPTQVTSSSLDQDSKLHVPLPTALMFRSESPIRYSEFQECYEEDVETRMACDAEDCGFQMLNDDEFVTSVQEELSTMKQMKTRTATTKVAMVHQMLTRFVR